MVILYNKCQIIFIKEIDTQPQTELEDDLLYSVNYNVELSLIPESAISYTQHVS